MSRKQTMKMVHHNFQYLDVPVFLSYRSVVAVGCPDHDICSMGKQEMAADTSHSGFRQNGLRWLNQLISSILDCC